MSSSCPKTLDSTCSQVCIPSAKPTSRSPNSLRPPTRLRNSNCLSRYDHARLLEINAHSLFSKWFSESGKLVQGLFGSVMEMIEDGNRFVVVLIGRTLYSSVLNAVWS